MIGTQCHAPNPILLLLLVRLCLKQQLQPPSATVIHRRLPWFASPLVSFIAGRAAAATISFWSRRRNHRQGKVLCHAYRIFLSVIHYWVSHFFIRSSVLHSGCFYLQFRTGFRIFLSAVWHLTSRYFYPQLWNGL